MSAPIDVGPPVYTSRAFTTQITGSNLSTAMRLYLWDDNFGGIADEDCAIFFPTGSQIHGRTRVDVASPTLDTAHQQLNLHMLNPIGYDNLKLNRVLLDLLVDQAHVGCGVIRMLPNGDGAVTQWAVGGYQYVDEPMDAPNLTDFIFTVTPGAEQRFTLPLLPSSALAAREVVIGFYGKMTKGPSGSDEGLGFGFQLHQATLGALSRLMYGDMYANGSINAARVKLDRLDILPATWNGANFWLALTAGRGSAGPSPSPFWVLYTLELVVYYTVNDPVFQIVDESSFVALDTDCATHLIDCDLIDTTFYEAFLDLLAHKPDLYCYVDYLGKLRIAKIGPYSAAGSPRALSTLDGSIEAVQRGPYALTERYANIVEVRWGIDLNHTTSGAAQEDPINPPADRGRRKFRRGASGIPVAGYEDAKVLDRHYIRRDSNKDVAEAIAALYLELWGKKKARGLDVRCPFSEVVNEPGDVVTVTNPSIGYVTKRMLVVEKTLDLSDDKVNLVLYDVENTL